MTTHKIEEADRVSVYYWIESCGAILAFRNKNGNAFAIAHMEGEGLDELIEVLTRIQNTPVSEIPNSIGETSHAVLTGLGRPDQSSGGN